MPKKKSGDSKPDKLRSEAEEKARQLEANRAKAAANRAVVALSSSWTGKLPATLLHEHCQKAKWEKVIFDALHVKDGFLVTITLGQKNPKTNQIETVKFKPPADLIKPQPTALEARHFAATYTLHRIASHKNMKMLLPSPHKTLWVQLDEQKAKTPEKERPLKYAEDPFAAQRDMKKQQEERKVASAEYEKQREEIELKKLISSVKNDVCQETAPAGSDKQQSERRKIRFNNILSMSRQTRSLVESTIRQHCGFQLEGTSIPLKRSDPKYSGIVASLSKIGFEKPQIHEALDHCNTLNNALEWLLIHVPEDDLPKMFANPNLGINANIQAGDLKQEYIVRDIKKLGYSEELVREVLELSKDKRGAIVALTRLLAGVISVENSTSLAESAWNEEMESIRSIYDNEVKVEDSCCAFHITVDKHILRATLYKPFDYPTGIPGIALEIFSGENIPKYILLNITQRAGQYAVSLQGDFMILSIIQWIKENFNHIRSNPAKLSQISRGVSGETEQFPEKKSNKPAKPAMKKKQPRKIAFSSEQMKQRYAERLQYPELQTMIHNRQQLPAWTKKDEIVKLVNDNQIVLITGETGSGKSTQVVQFILDDFIQTLKGSSANIICTQPRRISAMGVAQRVADERVAPIGSEVGYVIRGESKTSAETCIRFVTSGVLLRMIQTDLDSLDDVSHVVVDEVHERSLDSDFLLILLKRICSEKKNLKVILMSATVDTQVFKRYFKNEIGFAHIEGRTFPVDDMYLDDIIRQTKYIPYSLQGEDITLPKDTGRVIIALKDRVENDLIVSVISLICSDLGNSPGGILVFMSGAAEIDRCVSTIENSMGSSIYAVPLHSALSLAEQRRVFFNPPKGKRKVVVSTNIAETSITIPDIVAVIDSGRVKETRYDPQSNVVKLEETWASQAAVAQRRGRAGRVRKGVCYKLYTAVVQEKEMPIRPQPEMARAPLEQLYLSVKAMGIGNAMRFLNEALDPPNIDAIESARKMLIETGAIDGETDELTALGKHVSLVPVDIRSAKLLILSAVFGCLSKALTIVAMLSLKSPFYSPKDRREEAKDAKKRFASIGEGDLLAVANAYEEWVAMRKKSSSGAVKAWCNVNFIAPQGMLDIHATRRQLLSTLQEIGFVSTDKEEAIPSQYNKHNSSDKILRTVISASMAPNLAEIVFPERTFKEGCSGAVEQDPEAKAIRYFDEAERVFIHPSSVLFGINKFISDSKFLSYGSKMATSKTFINEVTPVGLYGFLFFSDSIEVDPLGTGVVIYNWIGLKCWPRVGILVKILRKLFNSLLEAKFSDPALDISGNEVLKVVYKLIEGDGR